MCYRKCFKKIFEETECCMTYLLQTFLSTNFKIRVLYFYPVYVYACPLFSRALLDRSDLSFLILSNKVEKWKCVRLLSFCVHILTLENILQVTEN